MRTTTATETTTRKNRKAAPRPEQLGAAIDTLTSGAATTATAEVILPADEVESKPELDPEIAELLAKEEAKAKKVAAELARRQARIEAYKSGKPIPPAGGKGLPPVVKMNELGALARQLHRAAELIFSDDVQPFATEAGVGHWSVAEDIRKLRDAAIKSWEEQFQRRVDAGAADNDTLHPLGLERDAMKGKVRLVEKSK